MSGNRKLERHRFSFEGANTLLAGHLIDDHSVKPLDVSPWCTGASRVDWAALDELHQQAHAGKASHQHSGGHAVDVTTWEVKA